jgi:pectate lyase
MMRTCAPRRALLGATALATLLAAPRASALPAFPGAEGFGAVATGGRGGKVIKVTTLAASGPGSLQAALSEAGPRIVVFAVSGVIDGDVTVEQGDVTIAGQTAPGAGITIRGRFFAAYDEAVQNIIVRHLRVRPAYDGSAGEQFDAIQFSRNSRIIFDHISVAWGVDEDMDLYEADDVTVQWSTIEESATEGHPEGQHNYGMINGPDGHNASLHHTLFAHHRARCPAFANGPAEVRNNVAYNVRHGFVHHNPASGPFNIVGNTYIQGPDDDLIPFYFDDENGGGDSGLQYWLADNYVDDPGDYVGVVDNPWQAPPIHPSFEDLALDESHRAAAEFDFSARVPGYLKISTQGSQEASALVLEKAGAWPRDAITLRTVAEAKARSGTWGVHAPADLLEGLTPGEPPPDSDGDGMPDEWETEQGLDPQNGDDHSKVTTSGYTAIEDYINGLADALTGGPPPGSGSSGSASGSPNGAGSGANGASGAAGLPGTDGGRKSDSGCGCRVAPSPSGAAVAWAGLTAAVLVLARRRAWRRRVR